MWAQVVSMLLGMWAMASPAVLDFDGPLRTSHHIVGPLVATFACIAIAECLRPLRWCNLPLGVWLVLSPWLLGAPLPGMVDAALTGTGVIGASLVRGKLRWKFDGGWRFLWTGMDSSSSPEAAV